MKLFITIVSQVLLVGTICLFTLGCELDRTVAENKIYGPVARFGNGSIRSFMQLDKFGRPEMLGISFPESALANLPQTFQRLDLAVPQKLAELPFDHISFGWNPQGDSTAGIFRAAYFDVNFIMIPSFELLEIVANDPLSEKLPGPEFLPGSYIPTNGSFPMRGKQWLNPAPRGSDEGGFSQAFLLASYNEKVISYEPTFTREYLEKNKTEIFDIPQPRVFQNPGKYYPTQYSIAYNPTKKEFSVNLLRFVKG